MKVLNFAVRWKKVPQKFMSRTAIYIFPAKYFFVVNPYHEVPFLTFLLAYIFNILSDCKKQKIMKVFISLSNK